jgi:hypothetical protein
MNEPRPAYLPLTAVFLAAIGGAVILLFGLAPILGWL